MGPILSTTVCPSSQEEASAYTTLGRFSQDEVVALMEEVRRSVGTGEDLPPLVQAAAAGGAGGVRRYLQEGGGLWSRDTAGRSPLHWAAAAGSERLVRALLSLGANAGVRDRQRRTPLHLAAAGRNAAVADLLLAAGASTVGRDCDGRTPLMCAAAVGDGPLCQLLARGGPGPDLEASDHFKQTALHLAARAGRPAAVNVLVAQGASVHAVDDKERVPLHSVFIYYQEMQEEALLARSYPRRRHGKSQGAAEATDGDPAETTRQVVVGLLAGKDAMESACQRDELGMTPLTLALRLRLPAVARALIDVYRPDYRTDYFGKTALHWAARAGDVYVVRRLLDFAFSPWKTDMQGCDSVMLAVESRDVETVKVLLNNRKYIARKNWMGQTALHIAVSHCDVEMTRYLLERNAKVGSVDREGRTALFRALEKGEKGREVARVLLAAGAFRLQRGRSDGRERTLLHAAAEAGDAEMARELLRLGASPRAMDRDGESPLAVALRMRHRSVVSVLMERRYLRLTTDRRGRTPLHWAATAGWHREAHALQVEGCEPAQRDQYGRSAIVAAGEYGHWQLANQMCLWTRPKRGSRGRK